MAALTNLPLLCWAALFGAVLVWSGTAPVDRLTWVLEVAPAVIGAAVLAVTYRRFRLTPLLYQLILVHCVVLMVGGHYTYAEVPLFNELRDLLGSARNNYDKLGHFAQGFVPVMIARELVLRHRVFNGRGWTNFFLVCFALALSAFYEFIEWWAAVLGGGSAEAFLGTQGYVWDTQSDMFYALVGAVTALATLSRVHDRQLGMVSSKPYVQEKDSVR